MAHDHALMRSWLFVPGDSERKLERCWDSGADALIVDLEDAVAAERKEAARGIAAAAVARARRGRTLVAIRVNSVETGLAFDDLRTTIACRPDAYVLPKIMHAEEIREVSRRIGDLEAEHRFAPGSVRLVAIVTEHPRSVMALDALCSADTRTASVMWGTEDLSAAMGARHVKNEQGEMLDVFRTVRSLALLAASAHGLAILDTPVMGIEALAEVEEEARSAAAMGFTGKVAIHPAQVPAIHRGFAPTSDELAYARDLLQVATSSSGTFRFRGKMIDAPHLKAARRMVSLADPKFTAA